MSPAPPHPPCAPPGPDRPPRALPRPLRPLLRLLPCARRRGLLHSRSSSFCHPPALASIWGFEGPRSGRRAPTPTGGAPGGSASGDTGAGSGSRLAGGRGGGGPGSVGAPGDLSFPAPRPQCGPQGGTGRPAGAAGEAPGTQRRRRPRLPVLCQQDLEPERLGPGFPLLGVGWGRGAHLGRQHELRELFPSGLEGAMMVAPIESCSPWDPSRN